MTLKHNNIKSAIAEDHSNHHVLNNTDDIITAPQVWTWRLQTVHRKTKFQIEVWQVWCGHLLGMEGPIKIKMHHGRWRIQNGALEHYLKVSQITSKDYTGGQKETCLQLSVLCTHDEAFAIFAKCNTHMNLLTWGTNQQVMSTKSRITTMQTPTCTSCVIAAAQCLYCWCFSLLICCIGSIRETYSPLLHHGWFRGLYHVLELCIVSSAVIFLAIYTVYLMHSWEASKCVS